MIRKEFNEKQTKGWAPENNVEGNEWFWVDLKGMTEAVGGEAKGVQGIMVDEIYGGYTIRC